MSLLLLPPLLARPRLFARSRTEREDDDACRGGEVVEEEEEDA
jgi:hypothetical protein